MTLLNRSAHDSKARETLILQHLAQVRAIARRIHERLPPSVNIEDLVSAGILGLISAVDNYDEDQHAKLSTYAEFKIRGAILDSLRGMDWAPRLQRSKARAIEKAISTAEQKLMRSPTEDEIAGTLNISVSEYRQWLSSIRALNLATLNAPESGDESSGSMLDTIADMSGSSPLQILEQSELERMLIEGIEKMPPSERTVLSLYYLHEMAPSEIAQAMEIRPARVSQLKAQGVARLKAYLERRLNSTSEGS